MAKQPFSKEIPSEKKYPRGGEKADKIPDLISWHIRIADKYGSWAWNQDNGLTLEKFESILSKMSNFETMKWSEILNRNNHAISISDIIPEARRRLKEIRQDDVDELISLNLNGKKRVWGIRDQNILKILWWDPNHTVCPSLKRYT
jgi:hypothetical protein